jgi:N-acetylneuraminate synthase
MYNKQLVLMQCNTNYTADKSCFNHINLNVLNTYKTIFPNTILGLSDHTHGNETVLGAIALGARVIEKHFTDDNDRNGPDHKFSMTPKTWRQMVTAAVNLFSSLGDGVKRVEDNEKQTSIVQRRALYYTRDMNKGETIQASDVFPVRPIKNGELPPYELDKICGKKLKHNITADTAVVWEDFE